MSFTSESILPSPVTILTPKVCAVDSIPRHKIGLDMAVSGLAHKAWALDQHLGSDLASVLSRDLAMTATKIKTAAMTTIAMAT